jgi:hypothetical protein
VWLVKQEVSILLCHPHVFIPVFRRVHVTQALVSSVVNDQKETEHKDYQWSKGNRTKRLSLIKGKQNKKTINDQKETEQKDYQWSKGNITQRHVFIPVFRRVHVTQALVSSVVLCLSLIVFLFCFLLIIDSLCALFPFDTRCVTEHKDYQWSKGNKTQRLSMIKRKQNTKTINNQKETEQ